MSDNFRIALAGLGTVGGALLKRLRFDADRIAARSGRPIEIVSVLARDKGKKRDLPLEGIAWAESAEALARADVSALVELVGGASGAAYDLVSAALSRGVPVVTANKALLAGRGAELAELAEKHNAPLLYEAAVAALIPSVRTLRETLAAERVERVSGILNGTCNMILSSMEGGEGFDAALAEAQRQGYAEADPSLDIDGHDAAHKLTLLSALAFGVAPDDASVKTEGIRHLHPLDMRFARDFGCAIRLIARTERVKGSKSIRSHVSPRLIPLGHRLASVRGTANALLFESGNEGGNFGDLLLEGQGAGAKPTSAAVLSDLVSLARGAAALPVFGRAAKDMLPSSARSKHGEDEGVFYMRLFARDEAGSMARITRIFADAGISLARIQQLDETMTHEGRASLPVAVMTHATKRRALEAVDKRLRGESSLASPPVIVAGASD